MADFCRIPWEGSFILIRGRSSFLLVSRAGSKFPLLIESEEGEFVQGMYPDDLVVVSAPAGGDVLAAVYLLEQVRVFHFPLIALSGSHSAAGRVSYVVSANERVELIGDCARGTHPEQDVLCSAGEFVGMVLYCVGEYLVVENLRGGVSFEHVMWCPNRGLEFF